MKLFFAGGFDNNNELDAKNIIFAGGFHNNNELDAKNIIINRLYSFATEKNNARKWSKTLLLDSGAFTEFTTGKQIDIDKLIDFIKEIKPWNYIQLDKIGDEEVTWSRYLYMKKQGINPLPVIPRDSSPTHINRVLNLEQDYLCLGGLVPISGIRDRPKLIKWLDYLYREYPRIRTKKVHCLGIMQKVILERYPFYSADSSSWLSVFRYPINGKNIERMKQMQEKNKQASRFETVLPYIHKQLKLEKYITELWDKRGVKWED